MLSLMDFGTIAASFPVATTYDNLLLNGDFSDGTNYWSPTGYTIATHANGLEMTVNQLTQGARLYQSNLVSITGHEYFIYCELYPKYSNVTTGQFLSVGWFTFPTATANEWNYLYASKVPSGEGAFLWYHYTDVNYALDDIIYLRKIAVIDKTATWGAGSEPTDEWMMTNVVPNINY